jgi:hypothetical protein
MTKIYQDQNKKLMLDEMYKYLIIDVEGKETHVESKEKPTTEEMQKIVGGNPTLVHCRYEGKGRQMIINVKGKQFVKRKSKDWIANTKATKMFRLFRQSLYAAHNSEIKYEHILGTAIIFKNFGLHNDENERIWEKLYAEAKAKSMQMNNYKN